MSDHKASFRLPALKRRFIELFSAAVIVGLFGFAQAYALTLGEIQVNSRLGQPLDAVVQISAAPGEVLRADCFTVSRAGNGLPSVTNVRLSLSTQLSPGSLRLNGRQSLREPLSELVINVECRGVPRLTRTFLVMLDPPVVSDPRSETGFSTAALSATAAPATVAEPVAPSARASRSPLAALSSTTPRIQVRPAYVGPTGAIRAGSNYSVQPGDVLSMIAARVAGRASNTVWPITRRIVQLNPDAFVDGDPNLIEAGSVLIIPQLEASWLSGAPVEPDLPRAATTRPASLSLEAPAAPSPGSPTEHQALPDAAGRPSSVGLVSQPLPTMVLTQRLSVVSRERLELRRSGKIEIATSAGSNAPEQPQAPDKPSVPAAATPTQKPTAATTRVQSTDRAPWYWLWLLAGLLIGAAAAFFGLRGQMRRTVEQQSERRLRAERYQVSLDQTRRQRSPEDDDAAIVVQEQRRPVFTPAPAATAATAAAEASATVAATALDRAANVANRPSKDVGADTDILAAEVAESVNVDPNDDLDFEIFEAPNEVDLELLERDYAQTSVVGVARNQHTDNPMLDSAELGLVDNDGTAIVDGSLDLELPEGSDTEMPLAFDVGEETHETVGRNDLTLPQQELQSEGLDFNLSGGEEFADDAVAPAANRDPEDFYHLEASSIMEVGDLSFEIEDAESEPTILEFKKRPGKTGTDDTSGED